MMGTIEAVKDCLISNPTFIFVIRVIVSTICGAVIGLERTKRSKEAGIRTHCIIACAATLVMLVSKFGFSEADVAGRFFSGTREADPSRIAAQLISGIGFLGAGVIFKNGNTVKGLTTAAGIFATAIVGLACGCGMYFMAIFVTMLIVILQLLMHKFSIGNDAYSTAEIRITMHSSPELMEVLKLKQKELGIEIENIKVSHTNDGITSLVLYVRTKHAIPYDLVMLFIEQHPDIISLSI